MAWFRDFSPSSSTSKSTSKSTTTESTLMDLLPRVRPECSLRLSRSTTASTGKKGISTRRNTRKGTTGKKGILQLCSPRLLREKEVKGEEVCRVVVCFVDGAAALKDVDGTVGYHSRPILDIFEDDASPVDAAWRTVQKQMTLGTLSIHRHGKPFISHGPSIGRRCMFYPFAFSLDSNKDSNDMSNIPDLNASTDNIHQALLNTYFELDLGPVPGRILSTGLAQLQHDHESGARKLAAVALSTLQGVLEHLGDPICPDGPWWRKTCLAAWHFWKNGRPSMDAAIVSFLMLTLGEIATCLTSGDDTSALCKKVRIHNAFGNVQQLMRSYTTRISHNLASYIRSKDIGNSKRQTFTILALSASSTIRECIVQSALASGAPHIEVRVLESRPLFEGVSMTASILSSFESLPGRMGIQARPQVRVIIYTDASVAQAATGADLFLLGADRIAADGSVSNKTGSVPAALSMRFMAPDAETIVVSEIYKVAMHYNNNNSIMENNSPSEVMQTWEQNEMIKGFDIVQDRLEGSSGTKSGPTVNVQNVYFEWVPPGLIDRYICEDGIKTPDDFERQAQWVCRQCEVFFGDFV